MTGARLTRSEVDRYIDVLDRSEPSQTGWLNAFNALKSTLQNARRRRDLFRVPLVSILLIAVAVSFIGRIAPDVLDIPRAWSQTAVITLSILFLLLEAVVRSLFPVLQQEGRVATLLRYYGAKNVSPDQAVY